MTDNINIAVIITCFNRKDHTLKALQSLFRAEEHYNNCNSDRISLRVFLTDDGCTDDTADAIRDNFSDKTIDIIQGDGNLYWAGGMSLAWLAASKAAPKHDFIMLFNDDTLLNTDAFCELMSTRRYVIEHTGKRGIYTGVCISSDGKEITYGGKNYSKGVVARSYTVHPTGTPQPCYMTNANIMLIEREVEERVGRLDNRYTHSAADWAYGIEANKAGFPVYITANVCGVCDNDHATEAMEAEKVIAMSIDERRKYYSSPLHSHRDALIFLKQYNIIKYIALYIIHTLAIYMPRVYFGLLTKR